MKHSILFPIILLLTAALFAASCSTTDKLPEGEVLYTGVHRISYLDKDQKVNKLRKDTTGVIASIAQTAQQVDEILKGNLSALQQSNGNSVNTDSMTKAQKKEWKQQNRADQNALASASEEVNAVLEYAPNNSL